MINFCYDSLGDYGIGYPNLAKSNLKPDQFDHEWPRVVPLRLLLHFQSFGINHQAHLTTNAPYGSWYPVALAWHDFNCDYIGMMSPQVLQRLRNGEIKALFYYHEGDNPLHIRDHLRSRCQQNKVPSDCFLLVSANSAADHIEQCIYFSDHEYFFRWINRHQQPKAPNAIPRPYRFTVLNRLHKIWRAHIMADLQNLGVLKNSLWSYNNDIVMEQADQEHPLDLCAIPDWPLLTKKFLDGGPYVCDNDNADEINDHRKINEDLYTQSYCHVVIETLMDADGSSGCFLTEKTYKCIKFGQPFVIIGTAGSLAQLKRDGYKTFDHVIDPSYDEIQDATHRYLEIRKLLKKINHMDPKEFFNQCLPEIIHNQDIFLNHKSNGLSRLITHLI